MIEAILDHGQFPFADIMKFPIFGKILPDQAVGMFVEPSFPGVIRIGEVETASKFLGDRLMLGELYNTLKNSDNKFSLDLSAR